MSPDRFVLELLDGGGLLLDLETGNLFSTNGTSTLVWRRALAGVPVSAIASELARVYGISEHRARADVAEALRPQPEPATDSRGHEPLLYQRLDHGYRLSYRGQATLELTPSGDELRLAGPVASEDLSMLLRALAPKLLSLLGHPVLHASAVELPGGRSAVFLGASGAGKTTTAMAFVKAGCRPVSEDKLVLRIEGDRALAVLLGERAIRSWISTTRNRLSMLPEGRWCQVGDLGNAAQGDARPLATIVLIDRTHRRGAELVLAPMSASETAAEVFRSAFHGSAERSGEGLQLRAAALVAGGGGGFRATVPDGLEALAAAARRYTETMAS